jgi:hypothetical protein
MRMEALTFGAASLTPAGAMKALALPSSKAEATIIVRTMVLSVSATNTGSARNR